MYIVFTIQRPEERVEHAKDVRIKLLCAFKKHWQAKLFMNKEAVRELRMLLVSDASMTEEQRARIEKLESPLLSNAPLKAREEPYTLIYNADDSSSVDLVQVVHGWSSTYGTPVKRFSIAHCPIGAEQEPEEPLGHERLAPSQSFRAHGSFLSSTTSSCATQQTDADTHAKEQRWADVVKELNHVLHERLRTTDDGVTPAAS